MNPMHTIPRILADVDAPHLTGESLVNMARKRVEFAIDRMVASNVLPAWIARNFSVDVYCDPMADSLVFALKRFLCARDAEEQRGVVRVPATWWDHTKERFFPSWMLRRWPARYTDINTVSNVRRMCPHLDVNDKQTHIAFLISGTTHTHD